MRTNGNEVNVETLISVAKFTQAFASQIFEVDPPASLLRRIGGEIMLGGPLQIPSMYCRTSTGKLSI
jgi:hypothetical protein